MPAQIFLIAPRAANIPALTAALDAALAGPPVAALLVLRGEYDDDAYAENLKAAARLAQPKGCAVLAEDPALAARLKLDGTIVSAEPAKFVVAQKAMQPDRIAGAGPVASRHQAMTLGERGADVLLFGAFETAPDPDTRELAHWWAETFEIPAVLIDEQTAPDQFDPARCEFAGVGANIWTHPDGPATALALLAGHLEQPR